MSALGIALWLTTGDALFSVAYETLLDLFAMNDPASQEQPVRRAIQVLSGFMGMLLLPVLVAAALDALGAFRAAAGLAQPPGNLSGHVILIGLGKIGTRVLSRLREFGVPMVCLESDPRARGLALARRLHVPVMLGDVTDEGVLEAARVHRTRTLVTLTNSDATNLEAILHARAVTPDLNVVLPLDEADFAEAVDRTHSIAHPTVLTHSRSVTHLAAPAFAGAMMGRQTLGAVLVERSVLLIGVIEVTEVRALQGRTVAESFRSGAWRVVGLSTGSRTTRRPELFRLRQKDGAVRSSTGAFVWSMEPDRILAAGDRVLVVAPAKAWPNSSAVGAFPPGDP
ncbi:potassium channel family protein [Streptomyces lavendulae]|uniref:potassium channel family protein n=1 Tax=Streptomyces lavendulae TaxID=1914 RepID=UPI00371F0D26